MKNKQFFFLIASRQAQKLIFSADGSIKQSQKLTTNTKIFQLKKTSELFFRFETVSQDLRLFFQVLSLYLYHTTSSDLVSLLPRHYYFGGLPIWIIRKESQPSVSIWVATGSLERLREKKEWIWGYLFLWSLPARSPWPITSPIAALYKRSSSRLW